MNKRAQTVIQNGVTIIIIVVAIIIVAIMSAATTPLFNNLVSSFNLTGGMAIVSQHINLIMVLILSLLGLITAFFLGGGGRT